MVRFALKIVYFLLLFSISIALSYAVNTYLFRFDVYQAKPQTRTLILGDSHGLRALNPAIISASASVCQAAEPLIATFHKAREISARNKNIDTILISLSHHNISSFNDVKFISDRYAHEMFNRYYPLMSIQDFNKMPIDRIMYLKYFVLNHLVFNEDYLINGLYNLFSIDRTSYPYVGGYQGVERTQEASLTHLEDRIEQHFFDGRDTLEISNVAEDFILKTIEWSSEQDYRLVFVATPVHQTYYDAIPEAYIDRLDYWKRFVTEWPNVSFIDLSQQCNEAAFLSDVDHVNTSGAACVSERVQQHLSNRPQ